MASIFDHPWELGGLLAIVLACALELGRHVAAHFQIEQVPQRKEQMGTVLDGLFVLVSLLLGFSLTMGSRAMSSADRCWWKKPFRLALLISAPARFPNLIETIPGNCFRNMWTRASN